MNLDRVTAELAYDLVQREVWTIAEFQAWHIFKLTEAGKYEAKDVVGDGGDIEEVLEANAVAINHTVKLVCGHWIQLDPSCPACR